MIPNCIAAQLQVVNLTAIIVFADEFAEILGAVILYKYPRHPSMYRMVRHPSLDNGVRHNTLSDTSAVTSALSQVSMRLMTYNALADSIEGECVTRPLASSCQSAANVNPTSSFIAASLCHRYLRDILTYRIPSRHFMSVARRIPAPRPRDEQAGHRRVRLPNLTGMKLEHVSLERVFAQCVK